MQDILALPRHLAPEDWRWLAELLSRLDDEPWPEHAKTAEEIAALAEQPVREGFL